MAGLKRITIYYCHAIGALPLKLQRLRKRAPEIAYP